MAKSYSRARALDNFNFVAPIEDPSHDVDQKLSDIYAALKDLAVLTKAQSKDVVSSFEAIKSISGRLDESDKKLKVEQNVSLSSLRASIEDLKKSAHTSDMPDDDGLNPDHDPRYFTKRQLTSGDQNLTLCNLTVDKATVLNEGGGSNDTRIEGDTEVNLFFVDASEEKIGLGTNAPKQRLHFKNTNTGYILENSIGKAIHMFAGTGGIGLDYDNSGTFLIRSNSNANVIGGATSGSTVIMHFASGGNIGIGGTPATSAKLEINSTTGALLLPRMTTTQRDALTAINGMCLYNSTTDAFNFYENGAWVTK